MNIKTEYRKLKKLVTVGEIQRVQGYDTPDMATDHIMKIAMSDGPVKACALIDSLDPLTAAFIIAGLRNRTGGAVMLLDYAKQLNVQGLKGLCHARDEIYRKTGVFVI